MADNNFQKYYEQVRERDQKELENTKITVEEGTNTWTMFGLSLGIATIVASFITKFSIVIGGVALIIAIVGYLKKKENLSIAAIICSTVGIVLGILFTIVRVVMMMHAENSLEGLFH